MEGGGDELPPSPFRSSGPLFPVKMRELADDPTVRSVRWSPTGATLLIHQKLLEEELLDPEKGAFKTRTFGSFYRQMNMYGFRRARRNTEGRPEHSDSVEAAELREFYHMYFQRDQPELLSLVRRPSCSRAALSERRAERVRLLQGESPQDQTALAERPTGRTRLLQGESQQQEKRTVTSSNLFQNCKHQTPDGDTTDTPPQVNWQSMPVIPPAASPSQTEPVINSTSTVSTIEEGNLYDTCTFVSKVTSPGANAIYQSLWASNFLAGDRKTSAADQAPLFCSPRGSAMVQPQEFSLRPRVPGPRRNLFGPAANQQVHGAVGQAADVTSHQIPGKSCDAAIQQIPVIIGAGRFQSNTVRRVRVEQLQPKVSHEGELRLEVPRMDLEKQRPKVRQSTVPCFDAPRVGVPWQDVPQMMVPHAKVPQVKVPLSEVPQIHVSPVGERRLDARQIQVPKVTTQQTEVPHAKEPQHAVPPLEEQQTKRSRTKASPVEELPAGMSLIEVVWVPTPQAGVPQTKVAPEVKMRSLREPNAGVPGVQLQRMAPAWLAVPRMEVDSPFGIDVSHKVVPLVEVSEVAVPLVEAPQMKALPVEVPTPQPVVPAFGVEMSQCQREVPRLEVPGMKMPQIEMPKIKSFLSAPQSTAPPVAVSQPPQPTTGTGPTAREENPAVVEVCARCRRKSGPSGEHIDDTDPTAAATTSPVELESNTTVNEKTIPACNKLSLSEVSTPSTAKNKLSLPEVFVPPPARNTLSPSTRESPKRLAESSCHASLATCCADPVVMVPDPDNVAVTDTDDVSFLTVANFEEVITSPSKKQKANDEGESQTDKTPCKEAESKQPASPGEQESTHLCLEEDRTFSTEDVPETPKRKCRRRRKKLGKRAKKAPRKKAKEMTHEEEVLAAVRAIEEEVRNEEIALDTDEVPAVSEPLHDMSRTFHDKPLPQRDMPRPQHDIPRTPPTKPGAGLSNAPLSAVSVPIVSYAMARLAPEGTKKLPFKKRFYTVVTEQEDRSAAVRELEEQRALSSSIDDLIVLGTSITLVPPPNCSANVVTGDLRTENEQKTPEFDTTSSPSVSQGQVYVPINYNSGQKVINVTPEVECGEENFQDFEIVEIVELDCEIATEQCLRDGQCVTSDGEVQPKTIQRQQGEGHVDQTSNPGAQSALPLISASCDDVTIV